MSNEIDCLLGVEALLPVEIINLIRNGCDKLYSENQLTDAEYRELDEYEKLMS